MASRYSSSHRPSRSSADSASYNPLRWLTMAAATRSIETVVLGFILVTLAYFQLLHAVKHSEFLDPASLDYPTAGGLLDRFGSHAIFRGASQSSGNEDVTYGASASASASASGVHSAPSTAGEGSSGIIIVRDPESGSWTEVNSGDSIHQISVQLHRIIVSLDADPSQLSLGANGANRLVYDQASPESIVGAGVPDAADPRFERIQVPYGSARRNATASAAHASLADADVRTSIREFESHLVTSAFGSPNLRFFPDLCATSDTVTSPETQESCLGVQYWPLKTGDGADRPIRAAVITLPFKPTSEASEWLHHLVTAQPVTDANGFSYVPLSALSAKREDAGLGLSFKAFPTSGSLAGSTYHMPHLKGHAAPSELKSVKWMLYAARAFVLRFYAAARRADSADIFIMLIGYIMMHLTFINLFINMRRLGSKFWLGCSTLVSGVFALLLALFTAYLLGVSINPIIMSEALPFLVITVGFEKPFRLAKSVFTNPALTPVSGPSTTGLLRSRVPSRLHLPAMNGRVGASGPAANHEHDDGVGLASEPMSAPLRSNGIRWGTPVPARDIVLQGFDKSGRPIIRDYAIEIAVLLAGSFAGVPGLREFCQLAALILVYDCLFLFGFFASVLTVMVEVRRIRIMRGLRKVDSSVDLAHILDDGTTPDLNAHEPPESPTTMQKFGRLLFGGPLQTQGESENPTARLKLLLIAAFLILHALNLCTTLTAKTAFTRHTAASGSPGSLPTPTGSAGSSSLASASDPLSAGLASTLEYMSASFPISAADSAPLVVQVAQPAVFRMLLPGQSVEDITRAMTSIVSDKTRVGSSMALLDRFMSGWTKLVGDPVLSKWIVIVLAVSVFLNGYLLKGIALGDQVTGEGFVPSSAPEAATRLLLGGSQPADKMQKLKRRWSGGIEDMSKRQTKWTLADAAEMAKERRKELIEVEKERDAAHAQSVKTKRSRKRSGIINGADSSDESGPGSPLFMSTKKRSTPHPTGRLVSANEDNLDVPNGASLPPMVMTPAGSENGKMLTPCSVSETSSDAATDTPATTVLDDNESHSETPTVNLIAATPDSNVIRPLDDVAAIFDHGKGCDAVTDEEVILLVQKGKVAAYALEKLLKDNLRAVRIRRALISRASSTKTLEGSKLPYMHYDYSKVIGQCCENVIGFTPIPIGVAGPLRIDGVAYPIPMATTEGALVASTSRGCKALNAGGGVTTVVTQDAMTRGPALEFPSVTQCAAAKKWIDSEEGSTILKAAFNSTTRFGRLQSLKAAMAGRTLFVRFACQTGDAMGMNMISKGTERALETMATDHFPEMKIMSLSGNYCTDKKPAAINWIEGRGKSVVAEGVIPGNIVKSILKTNVADLVKINTMKNLVGSAMAGTMGGNNAHSSNILTAIYLATGQDPAQNVESSNCMTLMEAVNDGQDLLITCTMPSIEVGTIGGGTILPPQHAMLTMLGVAGPHAENPGENARRLARIICAAVVAGELSLMSALAQGALVQSHMALNRSAPATPATAQITGHSYLTPAPTRPATPSNMRQGSHGHGHGSHLSAMTPMQSLTPAVKRLQQ